ncbi:MAG: xanthine dehydrogenase accessory protein XdhC [Pirellulales bacterium]
MPAPHGFIEKLAELSQSGVPFVSVTLVETVGSTPQDAGTKMLVDASGLVFGTVGGGRVESQSIARSRQMLADRDQPQIELVEWNLQRDVGMTCGGVVKLLFEAYNLRTWRIVIFGAGHVAQSLVRVLLELECHITCVDSRADWLGKLPRSPKLRMIEAETPAEIAAELTGTEFVLCMTMGHRTDRPILEALFRWGKAFPYLGAIGSAAKHKVLIRELTELGIPRERMHSLRCPIGLELGTNQPGEIAVSIAAELIQIRDSGSYRLNRPDLRNDHPQSFS